MGHAPHTAVLLLANEPQRWRDWASQVRHHGVSLGFGRGADAPSCVNRERMPDVLLLDGTARTQELAEVVSALRQSPASAGLPILVLAPRLTQSRRSALLAAGVADFLSPQEDVRAQVNRLCAYGTGSRTAGGEVAHRAPAAELDFRAVAFDHTPALTIVHDRHGRIVRVNKAVTTATGFGEAELVGQTSWEALMGTPEEQRSVRERYEALALMSCEEALARFGEASERIWRTKDGQLRLIAWHLDYLPDEHGNVAYQVASGLDVTERKRAEQEQLDSEQRLAEAQRIAALGSWELNLVDNALTWSDEIFRIFEIDKTRFDASYAAFLEVIHPEDREAVNETYQGSITNHRPYEITHRLQMADGRIKYVHERGETHYAPDGSPLRSVGTVQDITERHRAAEALRVSEQRLEQVLGSISDAFFTLNREWIYTYVNENAAGFVGKTTAELINRCIWDVFPEGKGSSWHERYRQVLESRQPLRFSDYHSELGAWYEGSIYPFEDGISVYFHNVTARKKAEQAVQESERQKREILDSMFAFVGLLTQDGVLLEANRAPIEAAQLTREDVIGKPFWETQWWCYSDESQAIIRDVLRRAGAGETVRRDFQVRMGDDRFITIDATFGPLRDRAGRITQIIGSGVDVSDRVRADAEVRRLNAELEQRIQQRTAELAEERNFVASVLDTQDTLVVVLDRTGKIVRFNRACQRLTGYSEAAALGREVWDLVIPPREVPTVRHVFQRLAAGDFPNRHENSWIKQDGSEVLIAWSNTCLVDEDGQVTYVIATGIDVTERLAADAALRESEARYRTLVETMNEGVGQLDPEGQTILFVNRALARMVGYAPEELVGQSSSLLYDEASQRTLAEQWKQRQAGSLDPYEVEMRRKDGQRIPVYLSPIPFRDANGTVLGRAAVMLDISALRRAEQDLAAARARLEFLLASGPVMIYAKRADGHTTFISGNVERALGYAPDAMLGDTEFWASCLHPEDRARVLEHQSVLFERGELVQEYRLRRADSTFRWIRDDARLIFDDVGAPMEVIGAWVDVTDRMEAERIAKELHDKEVLLREVHHRVKNNLQIISSLLYLQEQRADSPLLSRGLRESRSRVAAMAMIHEQLYSSGNLGAVDLKAYAEQLVSSLLSTFGMEPGRIRPVIEGDRFLLPLDQAITCGLIVNEIVSNSLKHAFPDNRSGSLMVRLRALPEGYELTVGDDGIGMSEVDPQHLERSLGLRLIPRLAAQLDARIDRLQAPGTVYCMTLKGEPSA